jgi:hypothetical protein
MNNTLARQVGYEVKALLNDPVVVSAKLLGDKFRELDDIILLYIEGKLSAEEVNDAFTIRSMLGEYMTKTTPQGGVEEQKLVCRAILSSYVLEMLQILEISEKRFGTRKGMRHILADKFLADRFQQDERDEIKKIANSMFFAHEKMVKLMNAIKAKYGF